MAYVERRPCRRALAGRRGLTGGSRGGRPFGNGPKGWEREQLRQAWGKPAHQSLRLHEVLQRPEHAEPPACEVAVTVA